MKTPLLREWREAKGETQSSLSALSGITVATISRIEHDAPLRPSTAKKLADALGVTVVDLMNSPPVPAGKAEAPIPGPSQSETPAEFGSDAYAKVNRWRDLIIHIGTLLQDLDGIYEVTPDVFEQMSTLAFTTLRTYKLENPKAGATPEQVRYLEEAEGVLLSGLRMLEERAERRQSGVTDLGDYRAKKAVAMAGLAGNPPDAVEQVASNG